MAAGDGLVSMTPTSIAHSGTSAVINADGGVDFSAVTSLSLNGVFTSAHDNYLLVINYKGSQDDVGFNFRLRAAGSDNNTANSYTIQALSANGSTTAAGRATADAASIGVSGTLEIGRNIHLYGPALAQPTAYRTIGPAYDTNIRIADNAGTHNQSTSYDGITLIPGGGNFTGTVHVFGYEE